MPSKDTKRIKPVIEEIVEEKPSVEVITPPEQETQVEEAPHLEKPLVFDEDKKLNIKLIIAITLVSALVAAFVSGGVYVYLSGVESTKNGPSATSSPEPSAEPSNEPTATPNATPAPVDVSKYTVEVLNGSGAIGAASGAKDVLTKAKFNVVKTGNAGRYDYKSTVIQAKAGVPAEVTAKAKKELETAKYKVEMGEALPASSDYDIVVIVGAN